MAMRREIRKTFEQSKCDALVYGHTHEPGQFVNRGMPLPIYNCGTWAETVNSFVHILPSGSIGMFDWVNGKTPRRNDTLLVVK
jgi:UDP-2,3-diacylglucosamine pyrophosphatase LpxH